MNSINFLSANNDQNNGFKVFKPEKKAMQSYPYLKQQIHDNKIDKFFWTDTEAPHKRTSWLAAGGAILGSFLPVLMIAKKQHKGLKINSLKNFLKALKIDYKLPEILAVGLGSTVGGLLGGLLDRQEKRKLDKMEEATYQSMNIAFPAILVSEGLEFCKNNKRFNNPYAKFATSALGIFAGASLAVNFANKIDKKLFDKYNQDPDRTFKPKDMIVHVDDVIASLVLAKVPFANKLHADKILPLIFSWSGFHVGDA